MIAYVYEVLTPFISPVVAREGDGLVVRPGHPSRPIVVMRRIGSRWRPVRVGPPNYGALIPLELDGIIRQIHPLYVPLQAHPLVALAR